MMKFLSIVGARPQFIKHAILASKLKIYKNNIKDITIHTGQHYDKKLSNIFFKQLEIPQPKYFLRVSNLNHSEMVGSMVYKLGKILRKEKPDIIILYGDTNSTLAGAICGSKENIPIAHVESGLRSHNLKMPEEINRIVTDRVSNLLFCPSLLAVQNLKKEGFYKMKDKTIVNSGDITLDLYKKLEGKFLKKNKNYNKYFLVTLHREENCKQNLLANIIKNLHFLSNYKKIILPAHPRIRDYLKKKIKSKNIEIIEPQGFFEFRNLIYNSSCLITDSGGVQKESFFLKKNSYVIRQETEWNELIIKKINNLINPNEKLFYKKILKNNFSKIDSNYKPYGNGKASEKIVNTIYNFIK